MELQDTVDTLQRITILSSNFNTYILHYNAHILRLSSILIRKCQQANIRSLAIYYYNKLI